MELEKKTSENPTKINFGRILASISEGFGAVLNLLGVLFAASWLFFGRSKSSFFQALAQNGLQEDFWIDLDPSGKGFGRIWGLFGRVELSGTSRDSFESESDSKESRDVRLNSFKSGIFHVCHFWVN